MFDIEVQIHDLCNKRLDKKDYESLLNSGEILDYKLLLLKVQCMIEEEKILTQQYNTILTSMALCSLFLSSISISLHSTPKSILIGFAVALSLIVIVWSLIRIGPWRKNKKKDMFLLEQYLIHYVERI